jgi:medium-chain acyl-[acyl-carrier-protein] hydrolase
VTLLAEKFSQAIQPLFDKPFAFFGHSLGGLVAFELARQLQQEKSPQPEILFVSASGAPHLTGSRPPIHGVSDSEFMTSLSEWNGIPSEITNQPEVMKLVLPLLRADVEAVESYTYHSNGSPLHIPMVAFAGTDDLRISREEVEGWALHTDTGFQSQYFPGDHFFINTCGEAVVASIVTRLMSSYEKN